MIQEVRLRHFRCFEELQVPLHPSMTLLVGLNAQGKTSFLEALCVALRLQSPRTTQRAQWIKFGEKHALIELQLEAQTVRVVQGEAQRKLAVDGEVVKKAQDYLLSSELVVWMDHGDMNLLRGSSEHRRRYMDFACAQMFPWYGTCLRNYERALRNRNFLLKRDARISWREVDAYGEILSEHAAGVRAYRAEFISRLHEPFQQAHDAVGMMTSVAEVAYLPGYDGPLLQDQLVERRDEEARMRVTSTGVHRDDLSLKLGGLSASDFASEGQQRTLSLSLKLGQAKVLEAQRGRPPVLLLDDVFGELDPQRRQALLGFLSEGTQKVIATTSLDWAKSLPESSLVYEVRRGELRPLREK